MNVELISIGDELLIGQTVNTNASFLGKTLNTNGFIVSRTVVVSDSEDAILSSLKDASTRATIVLITGGLGPTKDDITKKTLCKYFHTELVRNTDVLEKIELFFQAFNRPMLEVNRQQADLPANCTVLINEKGTASGMWFDYEGVVYVSLPGVPYEMTHLMENQVMPRLLNQFEPSPVIHRTIMTQGLGESFLAEIIKDWENNLAKHNLKLAYLPCPGILKLRISSYVGVKIEQEKHINNAIKELYTLIPEYIFADEEEKMEHLIANLLLQNKSTLGIAESCTGGYLAKCFTSMPGSSAYFKGSLVTYSNEAKQNILQIPAEHITAHGAISQSTVELMAKNTLALLNCDYAIATSGNAGPGIQENIPAGNIYFALASKTQLVSEHHKFGGDRLRNIERASNAVLNLLRKTLQKDFAE